MRKGSASSSLAMLLVLVAASLFSQTTAQSDTANALDGWGAAHWGMTPADAKAALGEKVIAVDPPVKWSGDKWRGDELGMLAIPSIEIRGIAFKVFFGFASGRLNGVSLLSETRTSDSSMTPFEKIRDAITEKYGPPTTSRRSAYSSDGLADLGATWALKKTTITVDFSRIMDLNQITISYQPARKEPNL